MKWLAIFYAQVDTAAFSESCCCTRKLRNIFILYAVSAVTRRKKLVR